MIWAVFLAVLALLALLGRTRLGLRGVYTPEEAGVWLRIGGVSRRLYPPKASPKPKKKREKAPPSKKEAEGEAPRLTPGGLYRLAGELLPLAWQGAGDLRRRLQVDRLRLEVVAAAPDPAEAAERYGQIYALLGSLWQPAVEAFHIQDGRARVSVDFDRTSPALYGELSLSFTASQLLWLGLRYGPRALNLLLKVRKQDQAAKARQRKAA